MGTPAYIPTSVTPGPSDMEAITTVIRNLQEELVVVKAAGASADHRAHQLANESASLRADMIDIQARVGELSTWSETVQTASQVDPSSGKAPSKRKARNSSVEVRIRFLEIQSSP